MPLTTTKTREKGMERHRGRTKRKRQMGGEREVDRQESDGENKVIWVVEWVLSTILTLNRRKNGGEEAGQLF